MDLDDALAGRSGPSPADLDTPEINAALDALGERIMASDAKVRPLRRKSVVIAASAALAAALAVGVPAAADRLGLHTGEFGLPGATENDTSEFLRADAPEMAELIEEYGKDYPLPPGGNWEHARKVIMTPSPDGRGVVVQAAGVRTQLILDSSCQWQSYWLKSYRGGFTGAMTAAEKALAKIPNYQVLRENTDDDGEHDLRIAKAARIHDVVSMEYAYGMCTGKEGADTDPPFLQPGYLTAEDKAGR